MESEAPKFGASSLAWHSCQVKPCELVCRECLCEVRLHVFAINLKLFFFLALLDSPMVE